MNSVCELPCLRGNESASPSLRVMGSRKGLIFIPCHVANKIISCVRDSNSGVRVSNTTVRDSNNRL